MVDQNKRSFLAAAGAGMVLKVAGARGSLANAPSKSRLQLIGTEEHFATPEYIETFLKRTTNSTSLGDRYARMFVSKPENRKLLTDFDLRVADMDRYGVDVLLLSLVAPGVQAFSPEEGKALARRVNDGMTAIIKQHPRRFAGLAAVAPQDPQGAAEEVDRAITQLGLNGVVINSHTNGEFLDDTKFFPIFEACVRNKAPIYLHPTFPSDAMIVPYEKYQLQGALLGLGAECSLHAARLIFGGIFDRYPELQIVLGHGGEGIPYWLYRFDNIHALLLSVKAPGMVPLKRPPSEYVRSNFYVTTSGMFWNPVLEFCVKAVGVDRVLFAVDSPFENLGEAAEFMRNAPLSAADKGLIAHGNARKLFRINI
jgi:5-carboxyvanillate decarboxylase